MLCKVLAGVSECHDGALVLQGVGQQLPPATWSRPEQQLVSPDSARAMEEGTPPDSVKSAGEHNTAIIATHCG